MTTQKVVGFAGEHDNNAVNAVNRKAIHLRVGWGHLMGSKCVIFPYHMAEIMHAIIFLCFFFLAPL